jgi:hypothetical protein
MRIRTWITAGIAVLAFAGYRAHVKAGPVGAGAAVGSTR